MQINEKVFKTLEYDKIRAMLASLATTEGARAQALALVPDVDEDTVRYRLRRTGDGVRLLFDKGMPSFGGVKDPADALERAGKGATLTGRELLDVCNLLRTARGLLDYIRTLL